MNFKCSYSKVGQGISSLDVLVLFLSEKADTNAAGLSNLPEAQKKLINSAVQQDIFSGKIGSCERLLSYTSKLSHLLLIGLGPRGKLDAEGIRRAAGAAGKFLSGSKFENVGVMLTGLLDEASEKDCGQLVSEGLGLGGYIFKDYKSSENSKKNSPAFRIFDPDQISSSRAVKHGVLLADATNFARDLGNTPPNELNPHALAEEARKLSKREGLQCRILDEKEMKKLGMGMLLGVSQGSHSPARLILSEYRALGAKQTLAIVGKGVTFDSGGISLKPGKSMDEMKFDMCGAAAVLGAMYAVAKLKPKTNVIGVIPATENLPGGKAQRPGDIVTAFNGKKVEILNTDAEGRLILGDALSYSVKQYKPDAIVDLATLTGACVVALGNHATGALTNNASLMEQVRMAGEQSGDRVWELPNFPEYGELLKGKYGDLQNIGGPAAGTITGGKFLENFVGDTPWVHLDIAGTAWNVKYVDYHPANGATGVGVRLLIDLIRKWKPVN